MSKALRHMKPKELENVITRRLSGKTKGLGYWAAYDATNDSNNLKPKSQKDIKNIS